LRNVKDLFCRETGSICQDAEPHHCTATGYAQTDKRNTLHNVSLDGSNLPDCLHLSAVVRVRRVIIPWYHHNSCVCVVNLQRDDSQANQL